MVWTGQVLTQCLQTRGIKVARLDLLQMSPKARVKFWKDETGQTMDYWFKRDSTTVIILDEMQLLYGYTEDRIWRLIKSVDGKRLHIKVLSSCFCS